MANEKYPVYPVLIVDDEPSAIESVSLALRASGISHIETCNDSRNVTAMLGQRPFEVVLLDLTMPYMSGEQILEFISSKFPELPVIIITGTDELDTAISCMKSGAFDYMVKPVEKSRLVSGVKRAVSIRELQRENRSLRQYLLSDHLEHPEAFEKIITQNESMQAIFQYLESISGSVHPVLITGETGTGKELIAETIHRLSCREGDFVSLNVAGLDDTLFSDTLFGHRKGAFTGAETYRRGMVEQAGNGTLFLDEIGDLKPESQVKLLRLVQEKEYFPLGSDMPIRTNTRILVATNQDLKKKQQSGDFRKDLYYRLCTHHVHLPPLRDRLDDLSILISHFLSQAAAELGRKRPPRPPKELPTLLSTYHFPGNIRELKAMIIDAVSRHKTKTLSMEPFRIHIAGEKHASQPPLNASTTVSKYPPIIFPNRLPTLKETEQILFDEALKRCNNNQTLAADMLGITRQTLSRYLRISRKKNDPC